ncbi:MAG TPA: cysteine--tRNA ligase, partial [Candidatus Nanoarchaeia archaeon]|nr:cysteine--tRNA ligase [Candidatus Nanoarchaeia archaeon]
MEKIFLYNTLTRKKEEFKPIKKGVVGFYQCGPTVYWTQHIGNLRAAVLGDIIRRVFEYDGYKVKYVKNYTDVGHLTSDEDSGIDKMEKAVKREGTDPLSIAEKYIKIYEEDAAELNIQEPWKKPRATKHIKEMQAMVKILLAKGFAYATPLAIYFDISKFPNYTALSGQNLEKNIAGEGAGEVTDLEKKHPQDFALWFFRAGVHASALQFWKSPFKSPLVKSGEGFPGWHIECSAMSKKYLGPTLDVHMGGIEHIPVHHTNEIAQSESANGVKYVNYWLHNEHLLVDNKKMAKSTGTGFTLAEVKEKGFSPLALRYYFLSANYRSQQNFTWEALRDAQNALNHLYDQLRNIWISLPDRGIPTDSINLNYKSKFLKAVCDDFNTPAALAVVQEVLKSSIPADEKFFTILNFDLVLGLDLGKFQSFTNDGIVVEESGFVKYILNLKEKRDLARAENNWPESDRIRQEIVDNGFEVKDNASGSQIIPGDYHKIFIEKNGFKHDYINGDYYINKNNNVIISEEFLIFSDWFSVWPVLFRKYTDIKYFFNGDMS